jgi:hypothetical protein
MVLGLRVSGLDNARVPGSRPFVVGRGAIGAVVRMGEGHGAVGVGRMWRCGQCAACSPIPGPRE